MRDKYKSKIAILCFIVCLLSNNIVFAISTSITSNEYDVIGAPVNSVGYVALYDEYNRLMSISTNHIADDESSVFQFDDDFKENMKTAHRLKSFLWDGNLRPLIDSKEHIQEIVPSSLSWLNGSCYDKTGAYAGMSSNRLMAEEYITVNPGDRIQLIDKDYVFILYGYKPGTTEWIGSTTDHYIDANPSDSSSKIENWGTDFTFTNDLYYGETKQEKIEYPLNIRMVIKHKNDINATTPVDISKNEIVMFDITTDNLHLSKLANSLPTLNIANLEWGNNSINDSTGETLNNDERVAMKSYIKVQPGDRIKLNDSKYKFILYGYTGEEKEYATNHYIDTNPSDNTSVLKNWGNDFIFTENLKFGNGDSVTYPLYIRLVARDAITIDSKIAVKDIQPLFDFDIKANNSHLNPVIYQPSTLEIAEGFKNRNFVSHRGVSTAPENTLVAFEEAIDIGHTILEADIQMTSDNVPVVLHDTTIDRTSNGTGSIKNITLETVKTYDFGSWKDKKYQGEKIPTLEELLEFCKEKGVLCELDLANRGFTNTQIKIIYDTVKNAEMLGNTLFTATDSELKKYIAIDYDIIVSVSGITSKTIAQSVLPTYEHCAMVFASVPIGNLTKDIVDYVHSQNMKVKTFTINNSNISSLTNAKTWGVDLILTDDLPPTAL